MFQCLRTILFRFLLSEFDWLLVTDDDTVLSPARLAQLLACYNTDEPIILGLYFVCSSERERKISIFSFTELRLYSFHLVALTGIYILASQENSSLPPSKILPCFCDFLRS